MWGLGFRVRRGFYGRFLPYAPVVPRNAESCFGETHMAVRRGHAEQVRHSYVSIVVGLGFVQCS